MSKVIQPFKHFCKKIDSNKKTAFNKKLSVYFREY